jgi:stalled ribosome rescue protein Dom34
MLAEAAAKAESLAGQDAWILVGGIPVVASALAGRLSQRLSSRTSVISLDVHAPDATMAEVARDHASRLRAREDLELVNAVVDAKARGGAGAVGVKEIERALVNGQVRELFLTSAFVQDHSDEAVDAIRRAFDEGARVEHVSGDAAERLDAAGGIAARLRFTIASDGTSASATVA